MADELRRLLEEMRQDNNVAHVETRRHFDMTVERLDKRFGTIAQAVKHVDEKLERDIKTLREQMRDGFTETHAMIKFSHAELDRRLRALE